MSGSVSLKKIRGIETVNVISAADMAEAVLTRQKESDVMILAAAVADYTPVVKAAEKIHKGADGFAIACTGTTDILRTLGEHKEKGQILIGFSMETEDMLRRTREKLTKKNCDYICANNLKEKGAGFGTDTNHITVLSKKTEKDLPMMSKYETACSILKYCMKGE